MDALPEPTRRAMTAAVVLGPVLVALGTLIGIAGEGVFQDPWQGGVNIIAGGVWMVGFAALGLTLAQRAPRLGTVLLVLGMVCLVTSAGWGVDYMVGHVHGVRLDPSQTPAVILLMFPGILFPPTLAATALGLWRTGAVPAAAGLTLAAGAVFFPIGRVPEIAALAVLSDLLLIAGSAAVAAALGTTTAVVRSAPSMAAAS
jgi:hypothetical protein